MHLLEHDDEILMLCEDLQNVLNKYKKLNPALDMADSPIGKRFSLITTAISTEERLIEEISLPGRFIIEHFSMMLGGVGYSVGFQYRDIKGGRGPLNRIRIGEWGTINLQVGDVELSWRDQEVQYMFYPDQVVVRPKDSAEDEISIFFSYSFKYAVGQLRKYKAVKNDPQTAYWHESLVVE